MTRHTYTFGDNDKASARLRRLAELYEPETRELLARTGILGSHVAIDLGCGPGWSTRLVHEVLAPKVTIGLDSSERYIAEARETRRVAGLEFAVHDVVRAPFPTPAADVLFCRFLLTHLKSVSEVLTTWAGVAAPGAMLIVHETEALETEEPSLRAYYRLVDRLQRHYGQALYVGGRLDAGFKGTGWRILESCRRDLEKPASKMAELHLANLRTWRQDPYAREAFDAAETDALEADLGRIASESSPGRIVLNTARQIIAQRS